MKNNWPTTADELIEECERLEGRYDLYSLGKPNTTEEYRKDYPDGTDYLAGEYQYGVAMVPAQWVTQTVPCLAAENAKLRDFAKSYLAAAGVDCGICPYRDPELCDTETDPMREGCRLWEEMRKLRVEVE